MIIGKLRARKRTVIMATNVLHYIDQADRVVFMVNGRVECQGKSMDLLEASEAFRNFVQTKQKIERKMTEEIEARISENKAVSRVGETQSIRKKSGQLEQSKSQPENSDQIMLKKEILEDSEMIEKGKLNKEELRIRNQMKSSVFFEYIKNGNWCVFILFILILWICIALRIFSDLWIASWSKRQYDLSDRTYALIYTGSILGILFFGIFRSFFWSLFSANTSGKIFKKLLNKIMYKPMMFFDTTPNGQLMNLLCKDIDLIEGFMSELGMTAISMSSMMLASIILGMIVNVIILPIVVIMIFFLVLHIRRFIKYYQEAKRLKSISFSPLISNISDLMDGLAHYRVLHTLKQKETEFAANVDYCNSANFHEISAMPFFSFYSDVILSTMIALTVGILALGVVYRWSFIPLNVTYISVSLSLILNIIMVAGYAFYFVVNFVTTLTSYERVLFNVDGRVMEESVQMRNKKVVDFVKEGRVEFRNIKCRYRPELDLVLDDLSFCVEPRQKMAIVGRTGSGKSSVLLALTRMLNIENSKYYPRIAKCQQLGEWNTLDDQTENQTSKREVGGSKKKEIASYEDIANQ